MTLVGAREALAANRVAEAERILDAALSSDPENAEALLLRASAGAKRGRLRLAESLLRDCLDRRPDWEEARSALVWVLVQRNEPIEALGLLHESLERDRADDLAAVHRAWLLLQLGRAEEALAGYRDLLARHPRNAPLHLAFGRALIASGRKDEALSEFRAALALDPLSGEGWWALANTRALRFTDADLSSMDLLSDQAHLPGRERIPLHFALGKALEDRKEFERAFAHYEAANGLQSHGTREAGERMRGFVERAIALLDSDFMLSRSAYGHDDPSPVFIIGMPRSGTTLLEQILASHSQIEATSELPNIDAIVRLLDEESGKRDYLEYLRALPPDRFAQLGRLYVEQAGPYRRARRPFFLDKMPSNWQHLGLIRLILPRATIIHIQRDPLDCCFANYAQYFPRGHEFSTSLDEAGRHYRLQQRMVSHFNRVSPGAVLSVRYERLVEHPGREVRRVADAIGVEFEEGCLRFYETERTVLTPSAQQVRQPLNRRGMGRWRNFEPWLEPLKRALAGS